MRRTQKGFTLMELMVVIVIVAILAAVAVPLYINYVKDAQRTEAKGAIGAIITAEQTYLQRYNEYKTCEPVDAACALGVDLGDLAANWIFKVTAGTGSFIVQAKGIGRMDGLCVTCTYTRGAEAEWDENTACP